MPSARNTHGPDQRTKDVDHILMHTGTLWEHLRNASIFVTGGTGFLGTWLVQSFLHANDRHQLNSHITVLSRNPHKIQITHPALTMIKGDVRTFENPKKEFTHIIHGATDADASLLKERPQEIEETILEGTKRVLALAQESNTQRLLFLSSGAVYGPQPPDMTHLSEEYEANPEHDSPLYAPYARGKRAAEILCNEAASDALTTTIARCFAFLGPNIPLDMHYAVGNFLGDAMHAGPIVVESDGRPVRSYLYTADAAVWFWTILLKGQSQRAYNVGSEEGFSIHDVAQMVAAAIGTHPEIQILQKTDLSKPAPRYVPSTTRARQELNLIERIGLQEQIERTLHAILPAHAAD